MKSLYESILGSTKSGAHAMIQKWCEENLDFWNTPGVSNANDFQILPDGRITNFGKYNMNLKHVNKKVPDYIRFAEISEYFYAGTALKYMKQEQLPPKVGLLYISGQIETIPSFEMECTHGLYINEYPQSLKHIEPIYIECHSTNCGNHKPIINLDLTQIEIDDLKNIHITGDVRDLYIKKTPAAKELQKTVKKLDKKTAKSGYVHIPGSDSVPPFEDYLNEIFPEKDWPGLRFVYLGDRTMLEHNPKTKHWYLV